MILGMGWEEDISRELRILEGNSKKVIWTVKTCIIIDNVDSEIWIYL